MSSIAQISYNVVIDRLRAFATGHEMINSFSHGQISLVDLPKDKEYPAMHVVPGQVLIDRGQRQFTFDVVFFDKPRSKEDESDYQKEVISDCVRLAEDLLYEIKNGNVLFGKDVDVQYNNTIDPFMEGFAQVVTGVTLSGIQITVQNGWNACDIPATYSPGAGSGSGGSGSGSSGIVLKVNSVNNAIQNVLNLVNGNNITITDLGDGRVRISATGGGGGGADWGSIGGDIDDQTDLIARLDAIIASVSNEATARVAGDSANASAISSEATARANADTTLQTNINNEATARATADNALQSDIDQVAANLATETTARMNGDATNASDLTAHVNNVSNPHNTTKAQVGLGNVPNVDATTTVNISDSTNKRFVTDANLTKINAIDQAVSTAEKASWNAKEPAITAGTTAQYYRGDKTFQTLDKTTVGLGNVDNTSDLNKPISTATQAALNTKEATITAGTTSQYYRGDKTFQTLDKAAVGLGNVDNTSDLNKPISTAVQAALNAKYGVFRTLSTSITLAGSSGDRFYTIQSSANSGTESAVTMSAEHAMTITEIRVRTTNTQPSTGSLVFTLRRNGADTTLVLTIAANAAVGVFTATGSIAIAVGDLICLKIRNNATATSANIAQISVVY